MQGEKNNNFFPMFFDITGKKILIAGAGNIALRRVNTLLSFGAELTVVAPEEKEEIIRYAAEKRLIHLKQRYSSEMLSDDFFMVIAATSDEVLNRQICEEGKKLGMLVNNASDRFQCDFYFPAIVTEGDVVAGVCASGKDHRLVRKAAAGMRTWLKEFIHDYESV